MSWTCPACKTVQAANAQKCRECGCHNPCPIQPHPKTQSTKNQQKRRPDIGRGLAVTAIILLVLIFGVAFVGLALLPSIAREASDPIDPGPQPPVEDVHVVIIESETTKILRVTDCDAGVVCWSTLYVVDAYSYTPGGTSCLSQAALPAASIVHEYCDEPR